MKRRDFLRASFKSGLVGASALVSGLPLVSCTSFDRLFSLERENQGDEILVVGAGAAGLMAGHELKKKRIPFRIFEASSRIGGRVWSTEQGSEIGSVAELGAEFFEERHQVLFGLAREFNFEIQEVEQDAKLEPMMIYAQGRWWPSRELRNGLRHLTAQIFRARLRLLPTLNSVDFFQTPMAQGLDQVHVLDLWKRHNIVVDPFWIPYLEAQSQLNLGGTLSETSGLAWLMNFDREERSRRRYRLVGGMQQISYSLFNRLEGVIPGYRIRFQNQLKEIQRDEKNIFTLSFQTPEGTAIYRTKYLILALPLSQLARIQGIQTLGLSENQRRAIAALRVAPSVKTIFSFSQPLWRSKSQHLPANQGHWIGGLQHQGTWDSTPPGKGQRFMLSSLYIGGLQGRGFDLEKAIKDLSQIYPKVLPNHPDDIVSMNWEQNKHIQGNRIVFQPGQLTQFDSSIWTPEWNGRWQWAGEFTSQTDPGTLAGALTSGFKAAHALSAIYQGEPGRG